MNTPDPEWLKQCGEHRTYLIKSAHEMLGQFAQALLALSGGGIAISMTFLKDLTKLDTIANGGLVIGAWACWTFTLLVTLAGYFVGYRANKSAQEYLDTKLRQEAYDDLFKNVPGGRWTLIGSWIPVLATGSFIIGLSLMLWFVSKNFTYGRTETSRSLAAATPAASTASAAGSGRRQEILVSASSATAAAAPKTLTDSSASNINRGNNGMETILSIVAGVVSGLLTSVFFYRRLLLDPVRFRLAFLDPMTVRDNDCRSGGDGLDSTCHFLDCYLQVVSQAGMTRTANVIKEISTDMWILRNAPDPRDCPPASEEQRQRESGRAEKKRHWQNTFATTYGVGTALAELVTTLTPKWLR